MRTYKGIVCEKNNNDMIFMTAGGAFLRGKPLAVDPEIGDEVEFRLVATSPLLKKRKKVFLLGPALIAAILTIFLVATLIPKTNSVYAFIQIDGKNPIEIGVDEDGKVISVHTQQKLEIDKWTGQPLETVLPEVLEKVAATDNDINITTQYEKQDNAKLNKQIKQAVQEANKENSNKPTIKNNTSIDKDEVEIKKLVKPQEKGQQPSEEQMVPDNEPEKPSTNLNPSNEKNNTHSSQQQRSEHQNNAQVEHPSQSPTEREHSDQNNANNAVKPDVKTKGQSNPPQKHNNQDNNHQEK